MFVEKLNLLEDLIEAYYDLRKEFKKEGWTDRDLEMPPYYPNGVMMRYGNFNSQDLLYSIKKSSLSKGWQGAWMCSSLG